MAGVHWTVSVTATLSVSCLVSASACGYHQLHAPSCRLAPGLQLELLGRPSGARLPASALLSGLAQCGAALSSELLCTSSLTMAPVWAMT